MHAGGAARLGAPALRKTAMHSKVLGVGISLLFGFAAAPARALIIAPPVGGTDYASLRSEVIARIPDYAPGWTDHSESDPGVTLLDLFAFTAEDLAYRVSLDVPHDLLWTGFDSQDDGTQGQVAYLLLDAAYLLRYGNDVREQDWLAREGVDYAWTYAELREAAVRSVPEPATLVLLATGLVLLALGRRVRA